MKKGYKINWQFRKRGGAYLIFSLPQTNNYQQINNLKFNQPATKFINDRWGNEIGIFTLNDVEETMEIDFQITTKSCFCSIDKNYKLNSYSEKLLKDNSFFLKPNRFVNGGDQKIRELAQKIVAREENLLNIINNLYLFVLDYLNYGKPIVGLYSYKQALAERTTDCGGFSTFLASLLQSLNIPSRLVVGFLIKKDLFSRILTFNFSLLTFDFLLMHAWLELLLPDKTWFPLDPSIEWRRKKGLTMKEGGFGFIPSDRLVTSFGCDFRIKIAHKNYQIDILQKPIYI